MPHNSKNHSFNVILNPSPAGGSKISGSEYEFSTFKCITENITSVKELSFFFFPEGFPGFTDADPEKRTFS